MIESPVTAYMTTMGKILAAPNWARLPFLIYSVLWWALPISWAYWGDKWNEATMLFWINMCCWSFPLSGVLLGLALLGYELRGGQDGS